MEVKDLKDVHNDKLCFIYGGGPSLRFIDETQLIIDYGAIMIRDRHCGDVNWDGVVRISDISLMIDHLFLTMQPIVPIEPGNTNCSDEQPVVLTIGDISALVDHLFISRAPLCCE